MQNYHLPNYNVNQFLESYFYSTISRQSQVVNDGLNFNWIFTIVMTMNLFYHFLFSYYEMSLKYSI